MSIIPRNGRFGLKVWDPATGKPRWLGTFDSEQAAKEAEREATTNVLTVERWGEIWLSDYARAAPATRMVYRQAVRTISKSIGKLRLDRLERRTARRLANEWPRNTHAVARTMWNDAIRDGVCKENPWANLRLTQSRGRKDLIALTEQEVSELADLAESTHGEYGLEARAIILTLAYTAVRPGELCALKWSDLDAPERELHVRRSLDATNTEKLPKNGKTRIITVAPQVLRALQSVPRLLSDDYIFHTITERRLTKANLFYLWRPIAKAWEGQGRPHLQTAELRHAAATILLERGVSHADVAVQLGHEDGGALVMGRYGHPSKDRSRDRLKMAWAEDGVRRAEAG